MKFEAECREIRRYLYGDERGERVEINFLVNPMGDIPGWLIIRVPDEAGLEVGCTVTLTVEREGAA